MQIVRVLGLMAATALAVPVWAQAPGRPMQGGRPPMGGMMRSVKNRLPRLVESAARLSGASALTKSQAKGMIKLIAPWKKRPTMSEDAARTLFTGLTGTLSSAQKTALQNDRPGFGGRRDGGGRDGGGRDGGGRDGGGRMGGPGAGGPGGRGGGGRMGGPGGGGPGGGGPGGGGPGGGGPGGGGGGQRPTQAQMSSMRAMMASFNPFYTGTTAGLSALPAPMKEAMQRRRDRLNAALSQLQQKAR